MTDVSTGDREKAAATLLDFFIDLDNADFDALADCMAADGEWHRQGKILRGREMVLAALAERPRDVRTAHLVSNLRMTAGEGGALRARFYMIAYRRDGHSDADQPAVMDVPFSIGLYECRFVREGDAWKIADLRGTPRFRRST